jgi:hypothetical protein
MYYFRWVAVVVFALGSSCSMWKTIGKDGLRELLTPIVKKQAAFDLQCSEDKIQVVQLADVSYGAAGCGRRASYIPESRYCSADQLESRAKDVCTAVVANMASSNAPDGRSSDGKSSGGNSPAKP